MLLMSSVRAICSPFEGTHNARVTAVFAAVVLASAGAALADLPISERYGSKESCDDAVQNSHGQVAVMEDYTLLLDSDVFMASGFICPVDGFQTNAGTLSAPVACFTRGPGFRGRLEVSRSPDGTKADVKLIKIGPNRPKPSELVVVQETLSRCVTTPY